MDLDFLNQVTAQAEPDEGEHFVQHPCGTFNGTITSYNQKTKDGRPVWEFYIKTAHGVGNHSRWGFSAQDVEDAKTSQDGRDRLMGTIRRAKRLFVDLGVWSQAEAKPKDWNAILGAWGQLVNKPCQLVVKPNLKKPGYIITFVNAARPELDDIVDAQQVTQAPKQAPTNPGKLPPNDQPPGAGAVMNRKPPGMDADDIPF